jgi:hypothetical protein
LDNRSSDIEIGSERVALVIIGAPLKTRLDAGRFPIRVTAPGLAVSGWIEFEDWNGGAAALAAYVAELAASWRGWDGSRKWRDSSGMVEFSATHDGVGLVTLECSIRSLSPGPWRVAIEVPIEPGVLPAIADRVAELSRQRVDRLDR